MTVACGGGPSAVKAGVGGSVVFSAGLITAGLGLISPWLLPVAAGLDSFVYEALTACGTDPPPMPSASALSPLNAVGGILNPNHDVWLNAVHDLLLNWAWSQYCECTPGPQPTFTFPPAPAGLTVPQAGSNQACFAATGTPRPWDATANPPFINHLPALTPPGNVTNGGPWQPATNVTDVTVGTYKTVTVDLSVTWAGAGGHNVEGGVIFLSAAHGFLASGMVTVTHAGAGTNHLVGTFQVPANCGAIYCSVLEQPGGTFDPAATSQLSVTYSCDAANPGAATSPCAADPQTLEMLQQLLNLTQLIWQGLPATVHSYSECITHAGLTGNGTVTLACPALAVRVNITSDTSGHKIDLGSPNYLFDRGYIVPLAAEGPIRGLVRLVYNPQVYQLPNLTEQIGYSLTPGVTVSITELTRGP